MNGYGFYDVAFMSDGKIVLSQYSPNFSMPPLTTLDPTTGQFTQGVENYYPQSGVFSASDDLKKVLMAPISISTGPLYILETGKGQTAAHNHFAYDDWTGGFNSGLQAISGDGALVARAYYPGYISIFDGGLNYLGNLADFNPYATAVFGMDFSADGKHLYVVDAIQDRILDFSTSTWALEEVYAIGVDIDATTGGANYGDRVIMSNTSQRMVIPDAGKVISLDMAFLKLAGGTDAADVITGKEGGDYLRGFGGDDVITGGSGADTVIGGKGADKLTGGYGADTFVFAKGDTIWSTTSNAGVDVITDWEVTDKLAFGPRVQIVRYGEYTASSWTAAATIAPQMIASQNLTYLAVQVGPDVYVFAAPSTAVNTGAVESVVKLANTTLDKISLDNFLPVGDEFGNYLVGGAGDDRIDGQAGADIIVGGKGTDVLIGGDGNDVFRFSTGDSVAYSIGGDGVDSIVDFRPGDRLQFDENFTGTVSLMGNSTPYYSEALSMAMSQLNASPGDATRISAIQVRNDTFVFVGHVDSSGAHLDNVVKLIGVTTGSIQLDSFVVS